MRRLISAFMLCLTLHVSAQVAGLEHFDAQGIRFNRQPCILSDAEQQTRTAATQDEACLAAKGSPKIVVCLANYSDVKFTVAKSDAEVMELFDQFFNGKGIGVGDNPYSVCDYFRAMSNGLFTPEFVITDPITLSRNRRYYGDVNGSSRRVTFRNEALALLSQNIKDKVGELDTNEDGKIDGVIIVFPGAGANVGDDEGMHAACWTSPYVTNGVTYATELICPELLGLDYTSQGGPNYAKINGIGVYVHEMSHMLGLPDFYDINYKAPGMDYWSLMDYGEYWYNGYYPTPYTAYERNFMGWLPLIELSEPTYVSNMKAVADGGSAYVIYNDGNRDECYILENRTTADPFSKNICTTLGDGLMIYHVDYNAAAWKNNRINTDPQRQRMTIIPANGHFVIADNFGDDSGKYLSELRGHLWPLKDVESVVKYWGIAGNNALTDDERTDGTRIAPAATLYNMNTDGTYLMHKPITDIVYDPLAKTISFSFMGGQPTGIESPGHDALISGDAMLKVYSLDGRLVLTCRESSLYTLPQGIYVVRNLSTGETSKRFVGR